MDRSTDKEYLQEMFAMIPQCEFGLQPAIRMLSMALSFACAVSLSAQSGLGAAGGHAGQEGYTLNYSVGQIFNTVIDQSEMYISQGIQHPSLVVIDHIGSGEMEGVECVVTVFPNPVKGELQIRVTDPVPQEIQAVLFNMNGKILMRKTFESSRLTLPLNDAAPGSYLLSIRSGTTVVQTFSIIKTE